MQGPRIKIRILPILNTIFAKNMQIFCKKSAKSANKTGKFNILYRFREIFPLLREIFSRQPSFSATDFEISFTALASFFS